jgi:TP901-1 family phage major tail protein
MSVGAGKDFLLQVDTGGGTYVTVGGLRSSGLTGAASEIDVTTLDSNQAKELLDGAGIKAFTIKGSGILKSTAPLSTLRTSFLNQTLTNFKLVAVDGTWSGLWKINSFDVSGTHDGAQVFSIALASSGAVSFA